MLETKYCFETSYNFRCPECYNWIPLTIIYGADGNYFIELVCCKQKKIGVGPFKTEKEAMNTFLKRYNNLEKKGFIGNIINMEYKIY